MKDEIEVTVTQSLTELQITKDSSIQAIPLSNETYKNKFPQFEIDMSNFWQKYDWALVLLYGIDVT